MAGGNYGIPYVVVDSTSTPLVPINVVDYASESDIASAPFPLNAPIEGSPADCTGWPDDYIGDSHVLALDRHACVLYETFNTHRCSGTWNLFIGDHLGYANCRAASLGLDVGRCRGPAHPSPVYCAMTKWPREPSIMPFRFTMQHTKDNANGGYFVAPASHAAGNISGVSNVMGMRIRLKASFDISRYSPANQVILTAMKKYGMILADNGGYFYFQGVPDPRWNDDDLVKLDSIQSSNFEVVQMTPAWPGYDSETAPTGNAPTIVSSPLPSPR